MKVSHWLLSQAKYSSPAGLQLCERDNLRFCGHEEGVPCPGYQEGIVKAVVDESHRSEGLVEGLYDEDFPEINTEALKTGKAK